MDSKALDILERLEKANELVPSAILRESEDEASPLHDYLEWDNAEAAHRYRMFEAARLMGFYQENGRREVNRVRIAADAPIVRSLSDPAKTQS